VGGGRWGRHDMSYVFGGWEVSVHGEAAILYYVQFRIVVRQDRQVHTLHSI